MAAPKSLATYLRRSRPLYHSLSFTSQYHHYHFLLPSSPPPKPKSSGPQHLITTPETFRFHFNRSFSSVVDSILPSDDDHPSVDQSDLTPLAVVADCVSYDDSWLPIRAFISILDGYHDLTGLPWWFVVTYSTVVLRLTLFPLFVVQQHKLKMIGDLLPKLPPPFPPPFSGESFKNQITLFFKEKKAAGCPSFLWLVAFYAVQVPVLITWITAIHTMSRNHHPGFEFGGILWFQNLAECPNGLLGPIFPLSVAALHYLNVQVTFNSLSIGKFSSELFGKLVKYYHKYLQLLTIPILFGSFYFTQGPLICWFTNSSLTLIQQLALNHPDIRKKLGLPDKTAHVAAGDQAKIAKHHMTDTAQSRLLGKFPVDNLSPKELVALSVKNLSSGHEDVALVTLRLALDKDPEYVRALLIVGQILLRKNLVQEAVEYLDRAISKILISAGPHPVEVEDVDLLILSSTWAGSACIRQRKFEEGMLHLERIASIEEPTDAISKNYYYDGLMMLSSSLLRAGRKAEAIQHMQRAAAYDPQRYRGLLEQCENDDEDDFVDDLTNSRRGDR